MKSSSFPQRLMLLLILGAFALRLTGLTRQNIWWDEARNIEVALRPFWQIPFAPELDIQPPFYFWLLHGWGRLMGVEMGMDPILVAFVARYLSVAAGIVSVVLLYALTRRIAGSTAGIIALLIGSLSPLWLAESQEARMYTLSFALLTAAALAWQKIIGYWVLGIKDWGSGTGDRGLGIGISLMSSTLPSKSPIPNTQYPIPNTQYPISFILLSALALATHYNAVFILMAWYLWWGIVALAAPDRWRRLRTVFLCGLAMTILVMPLAPIALRQIPDYANPNLTVPTLAQYLAQNWRGFLGGYAADAIPLGGLWLWAVLAVAVGGWLIAVSGGRPTTGDRRSPTHYALRTTHYAFLLFWLFGGLVFYYIAVLDRGAFNIRYSSFVTPALYALMGIGLAQLGRLWRWLPLAGTALLLVGMIPAARADLIDLRFFREDTAGLAAWLRSQTAPGDVIFVDQKYPFGFYYDRYAIDPADEPSGPEAAPARYLFVDINTIDARLNEWAGDAERIFWVQWFESDTDPRGAVSFLLDKYGQRTGEEHFRGYRVERWDLTPPTNFVLAEALTPQIQRWRDGLMTAKIDAPVQAIPGAMLPVVIRWQRGEGEITRPLKARVALYNEDGARLAQDDRRILNDRHLAPAEWSEADRPLNVYSLNLPADLLAGRYTLQLLIYDTDSLEPVEILDDAGNPAGIEVVIGEVEIGDWGSGISDWAIKRFEKRYGSESSDLGSLPSVYTIDIIGNKTCQVAENLAGLQRIAITDNV
ncbi:MAG: glycosyltransferase family 39 protein [Caldilineaceae bacterium]|nr:glycosyltransferase family 39 protein [Caldilineaceae bacterium]